MSRDSLPDHDIVFIETQEFFYAEHNDPLGIINDDNCTVCKIVWTDYSLVAMYKLAERLGCTIVKDMVVNQFQRLHHDEQRRKRAHPKNYFEPFELPL